MPILPEQALESSVQVSSVHRRTTSTLLDWADDVADFDGGLSRNGVPFNSELESVDSGSSIDILKGLEAIAAKGLNSSMSSEQAAAKALLNAARHARKQSQKHSTGSRYMQGDIQRLCTPMFNVSHVGVLKCLPEQAHSSLLHLELLLDIGSCFKICIRLKISQKQSATS